MSTRQIWKAEQQGNAIALSGEIDYTVTPQVRSYLLEQAGQGTGPMALHLGELEYLDSSGLAVLIELRRVLMQAGRSLAVTAVSAQVRKIFTLTQVGQLFGV